MTRTERITITAVGVCIGLVLLVMLGTLWGVLNDVRRAVSSVDNVVKEIAKVQGVQETVLNQLDTFAAPLDSGASEIVETGSIDPAAARPGRPSASARKIWDDFDANQVRAYETYTEPRVWAVSGTVDSVQYGDNGYIYVGLDGLVKVGFRRDYERVWLDAIDKGQHLWFECEVRGPDEDGFVVCISPND